MREIGSNKIAGLHNNKIKAETRTRDTWEITFIRARRTDNRDLRSSKVELGRKKPGQQWAHRF